MAQDKPPCLVFVKVHIRDKRSLRRRLMMIKTKNQMALMDKMYRLKMMIKTKNQMTLMDKMYRLKMR